MQRVLVFSAVEGRSNNFAVNQTRLVVILREAKLQRSGRSPRGQWLRPDRLQPSKDAGPPSYQRGAGVGRTREVGVALGVAVAVGVGVGVGEPDGPQYLPPVLR